MHETMSDDDFDGADHPLMLTTASEGLQHSAR
jgi:hypothetical protein